MAIAFVKATKLEASSGNNCSGSVSWTSGDMLVVPCAGFTSGANGSTPSVSGGGGTWTTNTNGNDITTGTNRAMGGIASNMTVTGTSATLTVTITSADGVTAGVMEFSGLSTTGQPDATSPAIKTGNSTSATSNTLANVTADAVFVACEFDGNSTNTTLTGAGTGWTYPANAKEADGSNFQRLSGGYKIVSATGNQSDAVTIASQVWGELIAVYKIASGGGSTVNITAANIGTHKIGVSQSGPTRLLNPNRTLSDNNALRDATSRQLSPNRSLSNNLGLRATSVSRLLNPSRTLSDNVGLRDLASRKGTWNRTVSDRAGLTDALLYYLTHRYRAADNLGLRDSGPIRHLDPNRVISDKTALRDSILRNLNPNRRTAPDSLGLTDILLSYLAHRYSTADGVGLHDNAPSRRLDPNRLLLDRVGLRELVGRLLNPKRQITDNVGLTDNVHFKDNFIKSVLILDSLGMLDGTSRTLSPLRRIADQLGLRESLSRLLNPKRKTADSTGLTELVSRSSTMKRAVADFAGIRDYLSRFIVVPPSVITLVWSDRVHQNSATTGTGTFTLSTTPLGKRSFGSVMTAGDVCYGFIQGQDTGEWEVTLFTMQSDGTLARAAFPLSSSNGGSLVNFSSGVKDVVLDVPAYVLAASLVTPGYTPVVR